LLILASASESRKRLLDQVGIKHKVIISNVDESRIDCSSVTELVQKLSIKKAESVFNDISFQPENKFLDNSFIAILGCDSLFELNGNFYGKPSCPQEAFDRWKMMSGKSGFIHTGHCLAFRKLISGSKNAENIPLMVKGVISTEIRFAHLRDEEIENYIFSREPMGCAGGFAIDGKAGVFIESIKGCFSNVIGLSLPWLRTSLLQAKLNY